LVGGAEQRLEFAGAAAFHQHARTMMEIVPTLP
jgi:hypothetical protein